MQASFLIRTRAAWPFAAEVPTRFSSIAFVLFFALCVAVNWPGRLNEDSLQQFIGFYNPRLLGDLHSPMATYLWSLPAPFLHQPAAALIVQSMLIAFYAAMLPSPFPLRGMPLVHAAFEAVTKLSLVVLAGFVIKDVLLVGLLVVALACLQRAGTAPQPARWYAAGLIFLLLSLVVRPTNFVMIALSAGVIILLVFPTWRGRAIALGIAFAALFLTLPISAIFNSHVVKARKDHAEIQLILFDLSGISSKTGRNLVAELPGWPPGLPDARQCYTPSEAAIIAPWSKCRGYAKAGRAVYSSGRRRVIAWWIGSIVRHPFAYISHRLDFSRNLLDPVGAARNHPVYMAAEADRAGRYLYALNGPDAAARLNAMTKDRLPPNQFLPWHENAAARAFAELANLVVGFRGTLMAALLISLLLLGATFVRNRRGMPLPPLTVSAAAALAISNFVMHAFLGLASQERYLYPTVFCAAFASLGALRYRLRTASALGVKDGSVRSSQ